VLHQFLVSTGERFRLRVYVLGRGFGLATRYLMQSTQRIVQNQPESDREWEQIEALRHDFQALTDESLASLRALLTSLAAEKREHLLDRF
jgi:ferric-dicitrate binding protein FerR (iron transport regulator)